MIDTKIQWHPAFIAAMNLEMADCRDSLRFDREYNLNVKPLTIDLLITKNQTDISISNEIGCIFRGHNIIEYKDPADSLNIDVFFKVEGYACLYKAYGKTVDAVAENEITMTFVRDNKPSGLFAYFQEHGCQMSTPFIRNLLHHGQLCTSIRIAATDKPSGSGSPDVTTYSVVY